MKNKNSSEDKSRSSEQDFLRPTYISKTYCDLCSKAQINCDENSKAQCGSTWTDDKKGDATDGESKTVKSLIRAHSTPKISTRNLFIRQSYVSKVWCISCRNTEVLCDVNSQLQCDKTWNIRFFATIKAAHSFRLGSALLKLKPNSQDKESGDECCKGVKF